VRLAVWVTPGSRGSSLEGVADGRLRVRVGAPAHEGKANRELVRFVAELFGVPKASVTIERGTGGRRKTLRVAGVTPAEARRKLRL
jgi:hypothetical protein